MKREDEVVRTFAIGTPAGNPTLAALHDRMPVILNPDDWPASLGKTEV